MNENIITTNTTNTKKRKLSILSNDTIIENLIQKDVNINTLLMVYESLRIFNEPIKLEETIMNYVVEKINFIHSTFEYALLTFLRNYITNCLENLQQMNVTHIVKVLGYFHKDVKDFNFQHIDSLISIYIFLNYKLYKNNVIPMKHFLIIKTRIYQFHFQNDHSTIFFCKYLHKLITSNESCKLLSEELYDLLCNYLRITSNELILKSFLNIHDNIESFEDSSEFECLLCCLHFTKGTRFKCHQNIKYCHNCLVTWISKSSTCCMCRKSTFLKIH